jgi:hypothetical protein
LATKYTKWPQNRPFGHKIYQHLPLQGPPKFTQNWDFWFCHLATLHFKDRGIRILTLDDEERQIEEQEGHRPLIGVEEAAPAHGSSGGQFLARKFFREIFRA